MRLFGKRWAKDKRAGGSTVFSDKMSGRGAGFKHPCIDAFFMKKTMVTLFIFIYTNDLSKYMPESTAQGRAFKWRKIEITFSSYNKTIP